MEHLDHVRLIDLSHNKTRLILLGCIILATGISWLGIIDQQTTAYIDSALVQSSSAFVVARSMNALISFLQSTTINFGVGLSGAIGVGEILDPLNDLVEQYSALMKLSIGSLIIQKVMLEIASDRFFKILLTIAAITFAVSMYMNNRFIQSILLRLFLFLMFLRFILVLAVAMNGVVDKYFLEKRTGEQLEILQSIEGMAELQPSDKTQELRKSFLTKINNLSQRKSEISLQLTQRQEAKTKTLEDIEMLTTQITKIEQDLSRLQRLNIFNRDHRVVELQKQIDDKKEHVNESTKEIKNLGGELSSIETEINETNLALEGKSSGVWGSIKDSFSSVGQGISSLRDSITPEKVFHFKENLDGVVSNILNVMALFVLKTLILPLVFLFVFTRGFKLIWEIELVNSISNVNSVVVGSKTC
ncbi:MAG: hypothetical protein KJ630_24855 [Proteobacteria bacterium]|nr:hypothetical protein [Pseudomonadota bacterium]